MLSYEDLYEYSRNPRINEITLDLLREYYEQYLMPFIYKYNIVNEVDGNTFDIELRFDKENFCHLVGIDTIVKRNVNRNMLWNYKSLKGWNRIKSGKISFSELKKSIKVYLVSINLSLYFFILSLRLWIIQKL